MHLEFFWVVRVTCDHLPIILLLKAFAIWRKSFTCWDVSDIRIATLVRYSQGTNNLQSYDCTDRHRYHGTEEYQLRYLTTPTIHWSSKYTHQYPGHSSWHRRSRKWRAFNWLSKEGKPADQWRDQAEAWAQCWKQWILVLQWQSLTSSTPQPSEWWIYL